MRSIFVTENDEITISVSYGFTKEGVLIADISEESLKKSLGDSLAQSTIRTKIVVFRRPSFADTVSITGSISTATDGLSLRFNPLALRLQKMKLLLKSWNFTEEKKTETGEVISTLMPANEASLMSLDPVIANAIGIQLDSMVGGL